ncbi:HSP20-like chaperone [Russula emetica]|nr:HSP20-like chaperone [Russula emetica]
MSLTPLTHYFFNDHSSPIDRFIEDIFSNRAYRQGQHMDTFRPRMDIHHDEKANTATVTFNLPGMQKKDVSIDIHNNILTVSGQTEEETTKRDAEGFVLRERQHGKFSRSLSLPQGTKNEDVKASMANGVLDITFPKSVPETTPSKITIS